MVFLSQKYVCYFKNVSPNPDQKEKSDSNLQKPNKNVVFAPNWNIMFWKFQNILFEFLFLPFNVFNM